MTNLGRGGENEVFDLNEIFSLIRINIITSHTQTPIRIGILGPTWVTAEEAKITHCYLHLNVERGCKCEGENFCCRDRSFATRKTNKGYGIFE